MQPKSCGVCFSEVHVSRSGTDPKFVMVSLRCGYGSRRSRGWSSTKAIIVQRRVVSIWSWLAADAVKDDRLPLSPTAFLEVGAGGLQVE